MGSAAAMTDDDCWHWFPPFSPHRPGVRWQADGERKRDARAAEQSFGWEKANRPRASCGGDQFLVRELASRDSRSPSIGTASLTIRVGPSQMPRLSRAISADADHHGVGPVAYWSISAFNLSNDCALPAFAVTEIEPSPFRVPR